MSRGFNGSNEDTSFTTASHDKTLKRFEVHLEHSNSAHLGHPKPLSPLLLDVPQAWTMLFRLVSSTS